MFYIQLHGYWAAYATLGKAGTTEIDQLWLQQMKAAKKRLQKLGGEGDKCF